MQDTFTGNAGRIIKVGSGEAAYLAFVPHPLPPQLPPTTELWVATERASRALGELAGQLARISDPHLFVQPFIRREAVSSSRIEGTQADLADLYAYEAAQGRPSSSATSKLPADTVEV